MSPHQNDPQEFHAQAVWNIDGFELPSYVNQVVLHPGITGSDGAQEGVYLHLGHVMPPAFPTGPDGRPVEEVPVVNVGSFFLTPQALDNLAHAAQEAAQRLRAEQGRRER
ncbi:hypothetical protein [Nesterenkonia cremea]|uniref:Uncharacterized protein n=1 Tax=Nesterenkonia cremea TaxID=1882340 RepID=A0A917AQC2_9MICC|nr:hypothetical protein [Nesterenkonia cremea]GGE65939.1 hypothetical protein GCM10011401_11510 [Nesterenkonia cremea]